MKLKLNTDMRRFPDSSLFISCCLWISGLMSNVQAASQATPSRTPLGSMYTSKLTAPHAKEPYAKGPHGGQIVSQGGQKYEVNLDQEAGQVDVYSRSLAQNLPPPDQMTVILYRDNKTGQTIRLRSVPQTQDGFLHYQGALSPTKESFVAIGIQFDLSSIPQKSPPPSPEE